MTSNTVQETTQETRQETPREGSREASQEASREASQEAPQETDHIHPEDPQSENQLEADDDDLPEIDSAIDPAYENGRRYHAFREGTYLVPNDDEEQNRMDLVHHIYSLMLDGKLYLAPIGESPQRALDLGTGTGIWAIDFADQHASAEVIGTDLSPIQPEWTPMNCFFEIDDFEDQWVYKKNFDFIHARELEGCISDEGKFFKQAFDNLVPGGYIELQAMTGRFMSDDGTIEKATNAERWADAMRESSERFGKSLDTPPLWKEGLIKAGFVDVHQEIRKVPLGTWPKDPVLKEIGKYQSVQSLQAVESYTPMLLEKVLGWPQDEIQVLMAQTKKELKDRSIHLYLLAYFIWGRKPEES